MNGYEITERRAGGLIVTQHNTYGLQVWSSSRMTYKHKDDACAMCGMRVGPQAYRPITNLSNRMRRICFRCALNQHGQ